MCLASPEASPGSVAPLPAIRGGLQYAGTGKEEGHGAGGSAEVLSGTPLVSSSSQLERACSLKKEKNCVPFLWGSWPSISSAWAAVWQDTRRGGLLGNRGGCIP